MFLTLFSTAFLRQERTPAKLKAILIIPKRKVLYGNGKAFLFFLTERIRSKTTYSLSDLNIGGGGGMARHGLEHLGINFIPA
jgi:hypothetical protein